MSQTPEGFEGNVAALMPRGEHPLMAKRIAACALLGEINADPNRRDSQEWFDAVAAIITGTRAIRNTEKQENIKRKEAGLEEKYSLTTRYHSSVGFPMRHNPAADVMQERGMEAGMASMPATTHLLEAA